MEEKKELSIQLKESGEINYMHRPEDGGCAGCLQSCTGVSNRKIVGGAFKTCSEKD